MKPSTIFSKLSLAVLTAVIALPIHAAQTVEQAVYKYDTLIGNYNLINFGNATISNYGDTEGMLAIGGNLTIDGGAIATKATFANGSTYSNPALYVKGTFTANGTVMLQNGYASLPGASNTATWNSTTDRLTKNSSVLLNDINSLSTKADIDPRSASLNPNWDFAALKTSFLDISNTFKNAAITGKLSVAGQTLSLSPIVSGQHGAIIFNLDMNLLVGNKYNGQTFSNVQFNVDAGSNYIVNVLHANGDTLFGTGGGINFNQGTGYDRLLWNIVDTANTTSDTITFGNGGQFYGSILAPTYLVQNGASTAINGQIVSNTFNYNPTSCPGAELHYMGFDPGFPPDIPPTPEPSTYGLIGAALCLAFAGYSRWRKEHKAA